MENINNIVTPETPIQPIETPVTPEPTPTPSKSNIFKYLFIICFIVLLASAIYSFFLIKNLNSKLETIKSEDTLTEITPTTIPTEEFVNEVTPIITNSKIDLSAYIKSDDKKNNLVLNKNGKESIIDSLNKDSEMVPLSFKNIRFTNTFKYLIYDVSGPERLVKIFSLQNNSFIKNGDFNGFITQSLETPIITNDEKFLIYCSGGDYGGIDGAKIISLSDLTIKFDFIKYFDKKITQPNISCSYDENSSDVTFFYNGSSSIYNLKTGLIK